MLFFIMELDEEKILKDDIVDLDSINECIEATFAQKDVTLYHREGTVRYYTRDIDKHDFEYLWMVNLLFKKEPWFGYYIKQWKFLDVSNKTNKIRYEEDLLKEWTKRPDKP
ncbi:MAG: hypothetical protein NC433_01785 [Clostridiales bacterium]|nr:hypothetical protein [Clostridiales bacterium]